MKPEYKKTLNYLQYTLGYKKRACNKIIARYGKDVMGIEIPADKNEPYLGPIGVHIQSHWQEFMDFYGTVKGCYMNSRAKNPRRGRLCSKFHEQLESIDYTDEFPLIYNETQD